MPNQTAIIENPETASDEELEKLFGELPSEEEMAKEVEAAGTKEAVNPLDPDFILIFLFAITLDALDIVLEITGIVVIPKLIGILIDVLNFFVIVGWMNWRMGRIAESKMARQAAIQRNLQTQIKRLEKLKKIGNVPDKVFDRYMRRYGERMGKAGQQLAKTARKPLARALVRGAIVLLGEIAWLVGLIPFWTISVLFMLKEK